MRLLTTILCSLWAWNPTSEPVTKLNSLRPILEKAGIERKPKTGQTSSAQLGEAFLTITFANRAQPQPVLVRFTCGSHQSPQNQKKANLGTGWPSHYSNSTMLTRKLMKMIKPQEKDSCMNEAGESAAAFSITLRTSGRTSQRHRSACTRCFSLGSIIIWKIQCALHRGTQLSLTKPVSASYQSILKATRGALCSHWAHL